MPRRAPFPESLTCPDCERNILVTVSKTLWKHKRPDEPQVACTGSGRDAREIHEGSR